MKAFRKLGQLFSRSGFSNLMGRTFNGLRDLWATLGYRSGKISVDTYLSFYERGDIAAQIVDLPATTTWQFPPELRLEDDDSEGTSLIEDVKELDDRVGLWSKMTQVDRLSGIGRFGVLLLGLRGDAGMKLSEPVENLKDLSDVIFLKAFHEGLVDIDKWVTNEFDPRFGLPETYKIRFTRGDSQGTSDKVVHWSRIIHVAENLVDDETFGTPRLQRVLNKLDDLNKLVGSAAEIFWLAVGGILHADLDPEVEIEPEDMEDFEKDIIEAMQGMRRLIQTRGMTLSRLASSGKVDPAPTYEAIVQLISATARIPERVLFGSERGQLASTQDQRQWNSSVRIRQTNYATPVLVRAFLNRMELLGAIKIPKGLEIFWPPLDSPTEKELAEIAELKGKAATALAPGNQGDLLIRPWEAREMLGLTPIPEEAPEGAAEAFGELPDPPVDENDV